MTIGGRHLREDAHVIVDGRRVLGNVQLTGKDQVTIELDSLPAEGMHLLQLQNPAGNVQQ